MNQPGEQPRAARPQPRQQPRAGSASSRNAERAREAAERHFGHRSLLPGQEETMSALLDGHDVLLVSPTGSGKSLTYQVAGVLLEGCTLVVSPLLALQQDQIEGLLEGGPELRAARVSSAETEAQREEALARARAGELEFLFLSPEQLANPDVLREVAELRPSLVAVDEAHCVSAWGHDFRPDYFRLGELIGRVGSPRVIAMTATAALPVREDIVERLGLRDHRMVVTGFERDNVGLRVVRCSDLDDQRRTVLDTVLETVQELGRDRAGERGGERRGSGIVYCRTRKGAEEYAAALDELGLRTVVYHAGLSRKARNEAFDAFMDDEVEIVVATSAFGMGIDKPDIRYVVHAQVPESPDTYYQEVGRAGRDGAPATATLVYRPEDLSLGKFFSAGVPKPEDVRTVLEAVASTGGTEPRAVQQATGFGARKTGRILNLLELVEESGGACPDNGPTDAVEAMVDGAVATAEAHRRLEQSRVDMMRGYAETGRCRSDFLLAYFGEEADELCGICDNCVNGVATEVVSDEGAAFALHSQVHHDEFGAGTVTDLEDDRITVLFDEVGYRTLSLRLVEERDLLRRVEGGVEGGAA